MLGFGVTMLPQLKGLEKRSIKLYSSQECLSLTQKRYRRYKLMRGHLPWNRWTPNNFRSAIYKYVSEDDYKNLRSKKGLKDRENEYESISNDEIYNTAMERPITTHRKIQNVQQDLFQREFVADYKQSYHYNSKDSNRTTYNFPDKETNNPATFQSDLWTKYAFKTFLIDRTKFGNLPMYYDYAQHRHTYYTEIRNIKGSKEVKKFQEIIFILNLNYY